MRLSPLVNLTNPPSKKYAAFATIRRGWLFDSWAVCYLARLVLPAAESPVRPPDLITDGNGVVMKVKLTTKQKRDRRWKIKRRKLRRQKTGV